VQVRESSALTATGLLTAGAAYFLASDDSTNVTGHALVVHVGYSAGHSHGVVEMMGLV